MEPQETIYCYDNKEKKCEKKRDCLGIIAVILLAAFSVVIGLIIGASVAGAILEALAAVIVLAVIFGLLLILTIILMICNQKQNKKDKCKCCCYQLKLQISKNRFSILENPFLFFVDNKFLNLNL